MRIQCSQCLGTGLRMPLCDGPCENPDCVEGQVEKVFEKTFVDFVDMDDDDLVARLWETEDLNDWEYDFRDAMTDKVAVGKTLSDNMRNKIIQILSKGDS